LCHIKRPGFGTARLNSLALKQNTGTQKNGARCMKIAEKFRARFNFCHLGAFRDIKTEAPQRKGCDLLLVQQLSRERPLFTQQIISNFALYIIASG
jgi:hypothetical protein